MYYKLRTFGVKIAANLGTANIFISLSLTLNWLNLQDSVSPVSQGAGTTSFYQFRTHLLGEKNHKVGFLAILDETYKRLFTLTT